MVRWTRQNSGVPKEDESGKSKLLVVARRMFYEQGYAKTSMDELCARAGFTRGALYHNFGSKSGLLEAVVRQIYFEVKAEFEEASVDRDPWISFRMCGQRYLEMALEPEFQQIVFQDAPAVLGQRMNDIDREAVEPVQELLEEAMALGHIKEADAEALARMLNGAWREAALWIGRSDAPSATLERVLGVVDTLLGGLQR
ncbi:MAG: TetR/AcrR family transcriptional regulator [Myxococcales bacterium]|nr:TetR/AcrR family transcriptional regulator [Myxococcales bacterium]